MLEQYKATVLSTSHLTPEDITQLSDAASDPDEWMVMERTPGYFIKLYAPDPESDPHSPTSNLRHGHSSSLKTILKWAETEGYRLIEFDRDAPTSAIFPLFEH